MNLYKIREYNIVKTWTLMLVFFAILAGIGYYISQLYGNPSILYVFVGVSICIQIVSYWFSDSIVLSLHGAKEVKKSDYYDLYVLTENLCITSGMKMPKIYVFADPSPNAFATGRDEAHGVICFSSGILQILDRRELEGVIAHELSHVQNKDILLMTVVSVLLGCITMLADFIQNIFFWNSFSSDEDERPGGVMIIVGIALSVLAPLVGILIQMAISRKREFLADASAALLTRYPEGLASALLKIHAYAAPLHTASTATAHMFIANPFTRNSLKTMFSTHPSVEERVKNLRGMKL